MTHTVLHLSDPHFGTEDPAVQAALSRKIEEIAPTTILLTGDITQRARRSQFQAAREFFERFHVPVLCIPGNHDIPLFNPWLRFTAPYKNYSLFFPEREPLIEAGKMLFLGFDATRPFRHTRGQLRPAHLRNRVEEARRASPEETLLCLCIHQPILVYAEGEKKKLLIEAQELTELFSSLKIDLVLSGHIHLPLITTTKYWHPHLTWHFVFSGAGTCLSRRIRAGIPNSFNEIFLPAGQIPELNIRRHDFDPSRFSFFLANEMRFQRGEQGWIDAASS